MNQVLAIGLENQPTPLKGNAGKHVTFQQGSQVFSMSVDASDQDEGRDQESDQDESEQTDLQDDHSQSFSNNFEDSDVPGSDEEDMDSMKIHPMTQKQRLEKLDQIDRDMVVWLQELHDITAQSGLPQSTQFLEEHFSIQVKKVPATPQRQSLTSNAKAVGMTDSGT